MQESMTLERLGEIRGAPVYAADGDQIGSVEEVFYDAQTNQPEWIGVGSGFFGTKRAVVPVAGANVRDDKLLAATLDAIVVERPEPDEEAPQNLCLDKGYDNRPSRELVQERSYVAHIRRIGEEKLDETGEKCYLARRWVREMNQPQCRRTCFVSGLRGSPAPPLPM